MKSLRLSALAAALALAACSSSAPTEPAQAGSPSFDDGVGTMGSGGVNNTTQDGGGSLGSGNTASTDTTTQRGPGMVGSGN
jgi:hypothetical protein